MRIISGSARGTILFSPSDERIRPTGDRAKESLFNILMPRLFDATVLDLYCGSGALGLESLSRGAKKAVFVDSSRESLALAKKNGLKTQLSERAEWISANLPDELFKVSSDSYDLIFADPPYERGTAKFLLENISHHSLLKNEGWVILEDSAQENLPEQAGNLQKFREKQIGKTKFAFYQLCRVEQIPRRENLASSSMYRKL